MVVSMNEESIAPHVGYLAEVSGHRGHVFFPAGRNVFHLHQHIVQKPDEKLTKIDAGVKSVPYSQVTRVTRT